jgi:hypothetical protein
VEKIFDQMDKNHDDKLTLEEFKEGSKVLYRLKQIEDLSCIYFPMLERPQDCPSPLIGTGSQRWVASLVINHVKP